MNKKILYDFLSEKLLAVFSEETLKSLRIDNSNHFIWNGQIMRIKEYRKHIEKLKSEQKYICPKCNKKLRHSWCLDCNCETSFNIPFITF